MANKREVKKLQKEIKGKIKGLKKQLPSFSPSVEANCENVFDSLLEKSKVKTSLEGHKSNNEYILHLLENLETLFTNALYDGTQVNPIALNKTIENLKTAINHRKIMNSSLGKKISLEKAILGLKEDLEKAMKEKEKAQKNYNEKAALYVQNKENSLLRLEVTELANSLDLLEYEINVLNKILTDMIQERDYLNAKENKTKLATKDKIDSDELFVKTHAEKENNNLEMSLNNERTKINDEAILERFNKDQQTKVVETKKEETKVAEEEKKEEVIKRIDKIAN